MKKQIHFAIQFNQRVIYVEVRIEGKKPFRHAKNRRILIALATRDH